MSIMENLKDFYKDEKAIVEVKGSDRNMLPNNILLKIYLALSEALNNEGKKENMKFKLKPHETCEKIKNLINECKKTYSFLFLFHNLDCSNFYSDENMQLLSQIAELDNVTFVASIESINFSKLMITREIFNKFSFLYYSINTGLIYDKELAYLNFFYNMNQKNKQVDNYQGILTSLTQNQRDLVIFVLK